LSGPYEEVSAEQERGFSPPIKEIILENFMSYEYARIPLNHGLNLIVGPNGAGKSSVLLAISVAFGQAYTERSRKLSDLIRRGKDIARVSLIFDNRPREGRRPIPYSKADTFMLSRYLRTASRRYDDAPELELRDASGKSVAEADLIAASDDDLIVAEAKSNDKLGGGTREIKRAAAKRVRLTEVLGASQIILATTEAQWSAASITAIRDAVTGHAWPASLRPAVRLITSLGGDQVQDVLLDVGSGT
jgi:hypothetical protein